MSIGTIKALNRLNNNSVLMHDELVALKNAVKDGLKDVVRANKSLDPEYDDRASDVGAWRRVEPYKEETYRPLVQTEYREALLKKLDII